MINLEDLKASAIKFKKVWESSCKNHRVLYFQINGEDEGIHPHFHPFGEDHAFILEGELTYDLSFKEQLVARKNSLVFGWTNAVHGYHNYKKEPLHILVFATPEQNDSVYDESKLSDKNTANIRHIETLPIKERLYSNRVVFSSVPPSDFTNTLTLDFNRQLLHVTPCKKPCANPLFITFKTTGS